jgi:hypothetical protein
LGAERLVGLAADVVGDLLERWAQIAAAIGEALQQADRCCRVDLDGEVHQTVSP